jgi:hypothetical protein
MRLKGILTTIFALYGVLLFGLLIANSEFLFIEDHNFWINIVVLNLIFLVIFFIAGLIIVNSYQRKISKQDKVINQLKGQLYDSIKDDETREKMIKDFEKSLK